MAMSSGVAEVSPQSSPTANPPVAVASLGSPAYSTGSNDSHRDNSNRQRNRPKLSDTMLITNAEEMSGHDKPLDFSKQNSSRSSCSKTPPATSSSSSSDEESETRIGGIHYSHTARNAATKQPTMQSKQIKCSPSRESSIALTKSLAAAYANSQQQQQSFVGKYNHHPQHPGDVSNLNNIFNTITPSPSPPERVYRYASPIGSRENLTSSQLPSAAASINASSDALNSSAIIDSNATILGQLISQFVTNSQHNNSQNASTFLQNESQTILRQALQTANQQQQAAILQALIMQSAQSLNGTNNAANLDLLQSMLTNNRSLSPSNDVKHRHTPYQGPYLSPTTLTPAALNQASPQPLLVPGGIHSASPIPSVIPNTTSSTLGLLTTTATTTTNGLLDVSHHTLPHSSDNLLTTAAPSMLIDSTSSTNTFPYASSNGTPYSHRRSPNHNSPRQEQSNISTPSPTASPADRNQSVANSKYTRPFKALYSHKDSFAAQSPYTPATTAMINAAAAVAAAGKPSDGPLATPINSDRAYQEFRNKMLRNRQTSTNSNGTTTTTASSSSSDRRPNSGDADAAAIRSAMAAMIKSSDSNPTRHLHHVLSPTSGHLNQRSAHHLHHSDDSHSIASSNSSDCGVGGGSDSQTVAMSSLFGVIPSIHCGNISAAAMMGNANSAAPATPSTAITSQQSSSSSSNGSSGGGGSGRKRGRPLPEDLKDEAYWERRRKNNEAAKRSRDLRRAKEDEIAIRAAFLEQENLNLKIEIYRTRLEYNKMKEMWLSTQPGQAALATANGQMSPPMPLTPEQMAMTLKMEQPQHLNSPGK